MSTVIVPTVPTVPTVRTSHTTADTAADGAAATDAFVRRAGLLMAVGAASWSAALLVFGPNAGTTLGERMNDGTGLVFQAGALAVVTAMLRTGATGTSSGARMLLRVERVLLSLAMVWTVLHFADHVWADRTPWVVALDVFWPLSMLGMFVVGLKVFRARRWRGSLRVAPLIAETWAPVTIPAYAISVAIDRPALGSVVGGLHLLVGYTRLGCLMHRRPELTRG